MKEKLVKFTWTNYILSGIQHGIQHGHAGDEMSIKYRPKNSTDFLKPSNQILMYWDWIESHKTVNVRNGGDQDQLREIMAMFNSEDNPYPWGYFREDQTQNFLLTAVSIVLPERVFAWEPREDLIGGRHIGLSNPLDTFESKVYDLIKSTRHAS